MKKVYKIAVATIPLLIILLLVLSLLPQPSLPLPNKYNNNETCGVMGCSFSDFSYSPSTFYFIYGEGCPACSYMKPFIDELQYTYPNMEIQGYEIFNNVDTQQVFLNLAEIHNMEPRAVPTTFFNGYYWEGAGNETQINITQTINNFYEVGEK